jgi:PIN domain nuclease of toxin-antitoxin system
MNYLLDTHVLLWVLQSPEMLTAEARATIVDPRQSVFVSAVSAVEIAIKRALGKLDAPDTLLEEVERRGFSHCPLHYRHGERLSRLPPHHHDPFDRLLLAQAIEEGLTLVTHDRKFEPYGIHVLWT